MKRNVISVLIIGISLLVFMASCDNPTSYSTDEIPDLIPQVAFSNAASSRIAIDIDEETQHKAIFLLRTPLLQSFKGNSSLKGGGSYSLNFLDSVMNFQITPQSGGSIFLFEGTMDDDSGWLNVEYDQSSKTFSFEQCFYGEITFTDVEGSIDQSDGVIYAKGTDIAIDNSGYFQGWYEMAYAIHSSDDSWELAAMEAELFRGEMNSDGTIGTGSALFSDADSDPDTGTRFFTSGSFEDFPSGAPTTISSDNLSEWATILSSTEFKGHDNINDFSEGFWEIFYHMDDTTDYVRISDDTVSDDPLNNVYEKFKDGFSASYTGDPATRADLTSWQQASLIIERLDP